MSKFSDLLSKPLPSAKIADTPIVEGVDDVINVDDPIDTPAADISGSTDLDGKLDAGEVVTKMDEEDVELTPEESQKVDDTMNAVATPILIQSELNTEEAIKEFTESADCDIAEAEGFLTERTIVRLDKQARLKQLYEVAVIAIARAKKDRLYKKLQTLQKMERDIEAKLRKKYDAPAKKKAKEYLARARKSKSGVLARIANKLSGAK